MIETWRYTWISEMSINSTESGRGDATAGRSWSTTVWSDGVLQDSANLCVAFRLYTVSMKNSSPVYPKVDPKTPEFSPFLLQESNQVDTFKNRKGPVTVKVPSSDSSTSHVAPKSWIHNWYVWRLKKGQLSEEIPELVHFGCKQFLFHFLLWDWSGTSLVSVTMFHVVTVWSFQTVTTWGQFNKYDKKKKNPVLTKLP